MFSHFGVKQKITVHHKHQPLHDLQSTLKIARYRYLVIQGFSKFLGVVSSDDMANHEHLHLPGGRLRAYGQDLLLGAIEKEFWD